MKTTTTNIYKVGAKVPNLHVIKAQYKGPTNSSGSRVTLTSDRFEQRVTIPYDYRYDNALEMAEIWLDKHGFTIVGHAEMKDHYLVMTDTFKGLKES